MPHPVAAPFRTAAICGSVVLCLMAFQASRAPAITIVPQYAPDEAPSFDPNGDRLMAIANAAAAIWESYFPASSKTYEVDFSWADLSDNTLGLWSFQIGGDNNIRIDTKTAAGVERNWFFDPTPTLNEEYQVAQTLFSQNSTGFTGSPPDVLEVGFQGGLSASPPAAAVNAWDVLSTVIHEIGHELGINNANLLEGDWEMDPNHLGGANAKVQGGSGGHIAPPLVLMCGGCGAINTRRLPTATDIIVIAEDQGFDTIDLPRRDFIAGSDYNRPLNWIGGAVPDSDTQAFIRPASPVNVAMSANNTTGSLTIDNGSALRTGANLLAATGAVTVMPGSTLQVQPGGGVTSAALSLNGATLWVGDGFAEGDTTTLTNSTVSLLSASASLLYDSLSIGAGSTVTGPGSLGQLVPLPTSLVNDGTIQPTNGTLTINGDPSVATLDLDGMSGSGHLDASHGNLVVKGRTVGQFAGTVDIGPNRTVDFQDGWTLAAAGQLNLAGLAGSPATLDGGTGPTRHAAILGSVAVSGDATIAADVHFFDVANVNVPTAQDVLDVTGLAQYQATTIGGSAGTLRQSGSAIITATLAQDTTLIATGIFDMDGTAESAAEMEVAGTARLHVASGQIEMGDPAADGYDGTLRVRGALQIDTAADWRLDGTMQLAAGAEVSGRRIAVHGSIGTDLGADGQATVGAPLLLEAGYLLAANGSGDTLALEGATTVQGAGTVAGSGTIRQTGDLTLNADLNVPAGIAYDWDGDENRPSSTLINPNRTLTLAADALDAQGPDVDGHDGTIDLISGTLLVNNPGGAWRLDGTLNISQSLFSPAPRLGGSSTLELYGTINSSGLTLIDAPIVIRPGATIAIPLDTMRFLQPTTYAGGDVTSGPLVSRLDQRGDATVSASSTVTIARFDWDGDDAAPSSMEIEPAATLTLNVDTIDPDDGSYGGHLTADGGTALVHLPGDTSWTLEGTIDVATTGVNVGSVAGSPLVSRGTIASLNLGRIDADLTMTDQSLVRVDGATDTLILAGKTTYQTLAAFTGAGTLIQTGDADVTGPSDTDGVRVGIFDMDGQETDPADFDIEFSGGPFGSDEAFVVNASQIERGDPTADGYDGTLRLKQYVLEINTTGPWRLDGSLILESVGGNLPRVKGSAVEVHGTIDTVGEGRMQADVHFQPTAAVQVTSGEVLHFDQRVTYNGGSYTGPGTLEHNGDVEVLGDTTIDVGVFDMDGAAEASSMKVSAGTLVLNVDQIDVGSNTFDGQLVLSGNLLVNTPAPWTTSGEIHVVSTGALAGAPLIADGPIIGAGLVKPDALTNNGGIAADGGELVLAPGSLDLDGATNSSPIDAVAGDLRVGAGPVKFAGTATVGPARRMTFEAGWTVDGTVFLAGSPNFVDRAAVAGGGTTFGPNSKLTVTGQGEIASPAEFQAGGAVQLPSAGDTLSLGGDSTIAAGSRFSGGGLLVNRAGAVLTVEDQTALDVAVRNEGLFAPGNSPGEVTVARFEGGPGSTLAIEIGGTRPGTGHDRLRVAGEARMGGELTVALIDSFRPSPGDTFTILTAASLAGQFDNAAGGARITTLGGEGSFLVRYAQAATEVLLTDFFAALTGDMDCDGDVDFDDISGFVLGLTDPAQYEAIFGVPATLKGDTDGDGDLDFDDIEQFVAILSSAHAAATPHTVPEPAAGTIALLCGLMFAGRRSNTRTAGTPGRVTSPKTRRFSRLL